MKAARYFVPAITAAALGACFQSAPPGESVAPAGNYAGTVVAYPVGDMRLYGSPFDYGYSSYLPYGAGYGYAPYGYGYGYSPYALYGYPYATLYPPLRVYRVPQGGKLLPGGQNGGFGLTPWGQSGQSGRRVAIPRPGSAHLQSGNLLEPGLQGPPPRFVMPPLRAPSAAARGFITAPPPNRPQAHYAPPPPRPPPPPPPPPPERPRTAHQR
ncbi:MAG: hypothetical protein M3R65_08945 [Gemmatimonadota bacterium]|nr:hypothetical protein [Gemmatimonadota bacterium]